MYLSVALILMYIVLWILVIISEETFKESALDIYNSLLFRLVVVVQICFIFMIGYVYWQNYHLQPPAQFPKDILPNTQWVRENRKLYYINGSELNSIELNGDHREMIFKADSPIREYHFSPDRVSLLVVTPSQLIDLDLKTRNYKIIDALEDNPSSPGRASGIISGIRWAPNSRQFTYEVNYLGMYADRHQLFIYDLAFEKKSLVKIPSWKTTPLYWDEEGKYIYYFYVQSKDEAKYIYADRLKVYRIPVDTLKPEPVSLIAYDKKSFSFEDLKLRNIRLFLDGIKFSFVRDQVRENLVAENGSKLGIDQDDYLYFVRQHWFKKRLFKVTRFPKLSDLPRHQYKGGPLTIQKIRWLPGGRYAIMEYRFRGWLVLDPVTGRVGHLTGLMGHTIGWDRG